MSKNNYAFLINHFSSHEIIYSESKDSVEIINSFGQDNIVVDYDVADPTPFMVMFSFQHRHTYFGKKEKIHERDATMIYSLQPPYAPQLLTTRQKKKKTQKVSLKNQVRFCGIRRKART